MKKILIIEDDKTIQKELSELLTIAEYEPIILSNFEYAEEETFKVNPDLILLDINIPYINGELLLQKLKKHSKIPIIMVTSKNSEADELLSMMYGADDYITKPYHPNILKRFQKEEELALKEIKIDTERGILKRNKLEIFLTKNEMIILSYLVSHKNKIVTRDELMTALWNNAEYINDNALTVNISRLRGKLKDIGYENAIETRKGFGYILNETE